MDGTLDTNAELPLIDNFDPSADRIVVCLPTDEAELDETWPERPEFSGDVEVTQDSEAGPFVIRVDGNPVALVNSDTPFDATSVSVNLDAHVGPSLFDIEYGYV